MPYIECLGLISWCQVEILNTKKTEYNQLNRHFAASESPMNYSTTLMFPSIYPTIIREKNATTRPDDSWQQPSRLFVYHSNLNLPNHHNAHWDQPDSVPERVAFPGCQPRWRIRFQ